MIGEDERRLITGLRNDDRESLAAAYDAYGAMAYSLALRLLGSTTEAEDVVQESFLALWKQAERIDVDRGVRSYLMTIVHNRAVDRIRKAGRQPEAELDLEAPIASGAADPAVEAERYSDRRELLTAMGALPLDQRQAVELVYFKGYTINETASRVGVPLGTVKSRLRLALKRLRRELGTR